MKHASIEFKNLDKALAQLDEYKEKYVIVKVDYVWNSINRSHRFDICYVEKDLWRHA